MIQFNVKAIDASTGQLVTAPLVVRIDVGLSGTVRKTNPANFYSGPTLFTPWTGDVEVIAAGYAPWTTGADPQVSFRDKTVEVIASLTPSFKRPSVDVIRRHRGNFCGLVLDYLQYGPSIGGGRLLFTPGIVCETPAVRRRAFADYKAAGFLHFPLNLTNHSPVYHGVYPDWDDAIINDVLRDALSAGLIPGGAFMGDDDDTVRCSASPQLVCWGFPKWEQNGPDHNDTDLINRHFLACRAAYPQTEMYFHFTSRHAAGGSPEGDWWSWAWANGARGILYQQDLWNDSVQNVADRCADFLVRFQDPHNYPGWPKGPDFVMFEDVAYGVFTGQISPELAASKNRQLWALIGAPPFPAIGYGNG